MSEHLSYKVKFLKRPTQNIFN